MAGDVAGALDLGWSDTPVVDYFVMAGGPAQTFPDRNGNGGTWDSSRWAGIFIRLIPRAVVPNFMSVTVEWLHPQDRNSLVFPSSDVIAVDLAQVRNPGNIFTCPVLFTAKGPRCRITVSGGSDGTIVAWPLAVWPQGHEDGQTLVAAQEATYGNVQPNIYNRALMYRTPTSIAPGAQTVDTFTYGGRARIQVTSNSKDTAVNAIDQIFLELLGTTTDLVWLAQIPGSGLSNFGTINDEVYLPPATYQLRCRPSASSSANHTIGAMVLAIPPG